MPLKREVESGSGRGSSLTPTKKARVTNSDGKKKYTDEEEARFLAALDKIAKQHLWNELKGDEELSRRGANGIRSHWDALYRKLKKA
ncbi:hypothetical protein CI109_101693 [Kwoniella shandongensis]|uniref:Uncharacterized protein n=1 Tax=Kwoniella shandongensis TaxID=1734106 RepID=A0A5M6C6R9_9TREE|nr:uncharacterized protein CI109_001183 [Kwoniella shandongensis]KAA5530380.1 hypothetical protein CI109_001183 [Kwoniella shandongensis]